MHSQWTRVLEKVKSIYQFLHSLWFCSGIMKEHKTLAVFLVSLFLASGCLGMADPELEMPDVELPDDWPTVVQRSAVSPHLSQFADCEDLEISLKSSIAEEYRIQLLQAVEEEYYYGGGMWMEDDMVAESAMDGVLVKGAEETDVRLLKASLR